MKNILILIIIVFYGCQNNPKQDNAQKNNSIMNTIEKKQPVKTVTWEIEKFKDFEFTIPSNLILQNSVSNSGKRVYTNDSGNLALTIDLAEIPNGSYNSGLEQLIENLNLFGHQIKEGNKKNFSDFQIQNTTYDRLGNIEAVLVNQQSSLISERNIPMKVKSLFAISYPYYITVTLSNPISDNTLNTVTDKIKDSFRFLNFNRDRAYSTEFLSSSKKWILETFNKNVKYNYFFSEGINEIKPYTSGVRFSNFYFLDNLLCMDFKTVQSEYANGTEYITRNFNSTIKIPIEDIEDIYFQERPLKNGKCQLIFKTKSESIKWINYTENSNEMRDIFGFNLNCQDKNFIVKLKSEIKKSIR